MNTDQNFSAPPPNSGFGGFLTGTNNDPQFQNKLNAILSCDMQQMGRIMDLVGQRGQLAYKAAMEYTRMSPQDCAQVKSQLAQLEGQIVSIMALG